MFSPRVADAHFFPPAPIIRYTTAATAATATVSINRPCSDEPEVFPRVEKSRELLAMPARARSCAAVS